MKGYEVPISESDMLVVHSLASLSCLGGRSNHREGQDREDNLYRDQLVGCIGELALSWHLTGNAQHFIIHRWYANKMRERYGEAGKRSGDPGVDIPGTNLDAKASLYQNRRVPESFSLRVSPNERGTGKVYVFIVVKLPELFSKEIRDCTQADFENVTYGRAQIMGWITDEQLPPPRRDNRGISASRVEARELHDLMPIKWDWIGYRT